MSKAGDRTGDNPVQAKWRTSIFTARNEIVAR